MANNWSTAHSNVSFKNISSTLSTNASTVGKVFQGTEGKIGAVHSGGLFGKDMTVVGINVNKIPSIQSAIQKYVDNINATLSKLQALDAQMGFKGKQADAVKSYIAAVKKASSQLVEQFLLFKSKLTEVQQAYEAQDKAIHGVVTGNAGTLSGSIKSGN